MRNVVVEPIDTSQKSPPEHIPCEASSNAPLPESYPRDLTSESLESQARQEPDAPHEKLSHIDPVPDTERMGTETGIIVDWEGFRERIQGKPLLLSNVPYLRQVSYHHTFSDFLFHHPKVNRTCWAFFTRFGVLIPVLALTSLVWWYVLATGIGQDTEIHFSAVMVLTLFTYTMFFMIFQADIIRLSLKRFDTIFVLMNMMTNMISLAESLHWSRLGHLWVVFITFLYLNSLIMDGYPQSFKAMEKIIRAYLYVDTGISDNQMKMCSKNEAQADTTQEQLGESSMPEKNLKGDSLGTLESNMDDTDNAHLKARMNPGIDSSSRPEKLPTSTTINPPVHNIAVVIQHDHTLLSSYVSKWISIVRCAMNSTISRAYDKIIFRLIAGGATLWFAIFISLFGQITLFLLVETDYIAGYHNVEFQVFWLRLSTQLLVRTSSINVISFFSRRLWTSYRRPFEMLSVRQQLICVPIFKEWENYLRVLFDEIETRSRNHHNHVLVRPITHDSSNEGNTNQSANASCGPPIPSSSTRKRLARQQEQYYVPNYIPGEGVSEEDGHLDTHSYELKKDPSNRNKSIQFYHMSSPIDTVPVESEELSPSADSIIQFNRNENGNCHDCVIKSECDINGENLKPSDEKNINQVGTHPLKDVSSRPDSRVYLIGTNDDHVHVFQADRDVLSKIFPPKYASIIRSAVIRIIPFSALVWLLGSILFFVSFTMPTPRFFWLYAISFCGATLHYVMFLGLHHYDSLILALFNFDAVYLQCVNVIFCVTMAAYLQWEGVRVYLGLFNLFLAFFFLIVHDAAPRSLKLYQKKFRGYVGKKNKLDDMPYRFLELSFLVCLKYFPSNHKLHESMSDLLTLKQPNTARKMVNEVRKTLRFIDIVDWLAFSYGFVFIVYISALLEFGLISGSCDAPIKFIGTWNLSSILRACIVNTFLLLGRRSFWKIWNPFYCPSLERGVYKFPLVNSVINSVEQV